MLSEEEIMEYINTIKPKNLNNYKDETNCALITKKQVKAIQGLLDLYKQEKEKNKELKKYYATRKEVEDLKETIACLHESAKDYISKDKIKEKIEELKKEQKEYENSQEWEIQDDIVAQINVLEELLEEK